MKLLRSIIWNKSKLPSLHTAEGIKGAGMEGIMQDNAASEAARQAENYHSYTFCPKCKDEEGEYFDEDRQDKGARDAFYKKHGLKRMTIEDAERNPHHMAHYLNTMAQHFPDVAKVMNHDPINKEYNAKHDGENYDSAMKSIHPNPIKRLGAKIYDRLPKTQAWHNWDDNRALDKVHKAMTALSGAMTGTDKKIADRHAVKIKQWHASNPDFHHLSASQAYGTFKDDWHKTDENSGLVNAPSEKEFTKHWNSLTARNESFQRSLRQILTEMPMLDTDHPKEYISDTSQKFELARLRGRKPISRTKSGHDVYRLSNQFGEREYMAVDPQTMRVHMKSAGFSYPDHYDEGGLLKSPDSTIKAHEFYHHIIQNHENEIRSDTVHSKGGAKVWQKISELPDVNVGHIDDDERPLPLHRGANWSKNYDDDSESRITARRSVRDVLHSRLGKKK